MTTTIQSCNCSHQFQDTTYGSQKRLMNVKAQQKECTCTVCGAKHPVKSSAGTTVVAKKK